MVRIPSNAEPKKNKKLIDPEYWVSAIPIIPIQTINTKGLTKLIKKPCVK